MSLSRRRPWPYDIEIDGIGCMLKSGESGDMVGRKVEPLASVAPIDYSYASYQPYVERAYRQGPLVLGLGERVQISAVGRRYRYAKGVDCSIGGYAILGPKFTVYEPTRTGEIRGFVEALYGTELAQYALAGQYVLLWLAPIARWVVIKDFGSGIVAQSAVRFKDAGATPVDALYVTTSAGKMWQFDGGVWTELNVPTSGYAFVTGLWLAVVGNKLYRAWDNYVSACESDPTVLTNWGGVYEVTSSPAQTGQAAQPITWLAGIQNSLFVFKTDGIYTFNTDGTVNDLFPGLRVPPSLSNGRNSIAWIDALWVPYGDSFYKLVPSDPASLVPAGPDRLLENDSEVSGRVTCSAGHAAWFLYLGVWNPRKTTSYLLKLGSWMNPAESDPAKYQFYPEVLHGSLCEWVGKRITAMHVSTTINTIGTLDCLTSYIVDDLGSYTVDDLASIVGPSRMLVGFADGTIESTPLPVGSPNPALDGSGCEFQPEGRVYWSRHNGLFEADEKTFYGVSAFGALSSDAWVGHEFRTSPSGEWAEMPERFVEGGQRVEFAEALAGKEIEIATVLHTSNFGETPVIEGCALHEAVRPALRLQYDFTVPVAADIARHDGVVGRTPPKSLRNALKAIASGLPVTIRLPDETLEGVTVTSYAEMLRAWHQRFGEAWDIALSAVEWRTYETYGTVNRLGAYTVDDLGPYTVDELATL